jgi:hypothetical protein
MIRWKKDERLFLSHTLHGARNRRTLNQIDSPSRATYVSVAARADCSFFVQTRF